MKRSILLSELAPAKDSVATYTVLYVYCYFTPDIITPRASNHATVLDRKRLEMSPQRGHFVRYL